MLDGLLGALPGVSVASAPPASPAGDAFLFSLDNGKTNAFYRVQSVDGNLREVRYRESYAKPKVWHDTPSISSAVYTSRIDCSAKTMQTLMAEAYRDPDALTGPVVSKPLSLAPDPINLAKDSVGARIAKAACAVTRPDRQEKTEAARSADNPSSINEGCRPDAHPHDPFDGSIQSRDAGADGCRRLSPKSRSGPVLGSFGRAFRHSQMRRLCITSCFPILTQYPWGRRPPWHIEGFLF